MDCLCGPLTPPQDIESDELSPPPSPHKPRLKIKLKLPQILSPNESSSRGASTPSGEPSRPPSHRGLSRGTKDNIRHAPALTSMTNGCLADIESEDEDDDDEVVGGSTRPMTSRQAVLASVVDSSHVSLCPSLVFFTDPHTRKLTSTTAESSRKKKQLTESEIALRREETARKRKNLTEKKLEDEKVACLTILCTRARGSLMFTSCRTGRDDQPAAQETVQIKE